MATSAPSQHLSSARPSCQIAGRPVLAPRHYAPAVKIRFWRRFAASSGEVSLVPARILRPPTRRRNALRKKASQPLPPLVVQYEVRPPCRESPEFGSFGIQEPKSDYLHAEPSSDLDQELEISVDQSASWSGDSKLDELGVIGDTEEVTLCGTGDGPASGVYEDPNGNMMQYEVDEDEILRRCHAAESEGDDDLKLMSSLVRAIDMEPESGEHVAPNSSDNSSRFCFAAAEKMGSSVQSGEVSVAQRNVPSSRSVTWSAFAALCGICIAFVASKLIRNRSKARLPRKLFDMLRPGMKEDEFDRGNLDEFSTGQEFPDGLLRRPLLDRKELMSNIKRAQDSRKWSVLSNSFRWEDVATYDDTNIQEIRKNASEVHTSEEQIYAKYCTEAKNGTFVPKPIDSIEEEVTESYGSQSYLGEVSDSSESNRISSSKDNVEESMEQNVDLKNGAQIMNMIGKDQGNIGDTEVSGPIYNSERATSVNDKNSVSYTFENEVQIGSANVHKSGLNSASTLLSESKSKEQSVEICGKNLDCTQGIEPSAPFISENLVIYAKDNAHEVSTKAVSEPSDGFSISSSELTKNEKHLDNNVSDFNDIQETEVTRTSAENVVHTSCCKEFSSHHTGKIGTEACATPVMVESMNAASPHRNIEDLENLRTENAQSMQEQEPCISSWSGKNLRDGTENGHEERIVHDKTHEIMETDHKGILNNASRPSFFTPREETGQHTFAEVSTSEKKQERKKPRAHLPKRKGKLQKEVHNDKEAKTKQLELGKHGTETVIDPTIHVEKTKRVPKKRQKKVQNEMQRVSAPDDVQCCSVVDQNKNSQHAKRVRRKHSKKGSQASDQIPETTYVISSPNNASMNNMKPLGEANSSVETHFSKDGFSEDQPNGSSSSMLRKEELKLNF